MLSNLGLADRLDCALDLCLGVEAFTYLAKRAFTKGAPDLIPVMNIFCCLETLKEAELEDFLGFGRRLLLTRLIIDDIFATRRKSLGLLLRLRHAIVMDCDLLYLSCLSAAAIE